VKGSHSIRVRWKPFQLNPGMPKEGMDRREYREKKFGGSARVEEMDRRMIAVGQEEGIPFALDRIRKAPNTFDAHRLLWRAEREGLQEKVSDGLFRAFFTEGRDIGDRSVLTEIGAGAGLERDALRSFLESDEGTKDVHEEERRAREIGVDAVPTFIIGGKFLVSGAQNPEVFLEAFRSL
jgi:predicted DsbA family dithiol-disulfide isomerase